MDKNTQHLLLSELYSAAGYLERLNFALGEVYKNTQLPQIKELKQGGIKSLQIFIEREIFQPSLQTSTTNNLEVTFDEIIHLSRSAIEIALKFQLNSKATAELATNYINLVYSLAHPIHKMIDHYSSMEVQYPRTAIVEMDNAGFMYDFQWTSDAFEFSYQVSDNFLYNWWISYNAFAINPESDWTGHDLLNVESVEVQLQL